jgi:hypothetical protein
MGALRPEARALIRTGKTAFRPEAGDRERVLQSLTRTLGESATAGAVRRTEPPAAGPAAFPAASWALGGLAAFAVGAGALWDTHPWTTSSSPVAVVASSAARPELAPAVAAVPSVNVNDLPLQSHAESPSISARVGTRSSAASSPSDSLPEEVRLLSKAEQQLGAGHADQALSTLSEHERRFPAGALAEERLAVRVQSLCALGRVSEAKAELAKVARTHPGSSLFDRARRFCGIDTP